MKGYQDYQAFSEDFASLIGGLRWTEDTMEEEELINALTAMQTANKKFADKFLLVADTQETITLMEAGFGVTPDGMFRDFYDNEANYFNEQGY